MEIKVIQKIDEAYYKEFYSEWLTHRSVYKKWEHKIGMISILLAVGLYLFDAGLLYLSGGLLVFGVLMVVEFYTSKSKWMKDRLTSKINNQSVVMIFRDHEIQSNGPFTEMKGRWSFFKQIVETKKGIFLIPENGISIYLQKKSFERSSDIEQVIQRSHEK